MRSSRDARAQGSGGRRGGLAGLLGEVGDLVGHLRTLAHPVVQAIHVELAALFVTGGDRVVEPQALDVAAVARAAAVGDDDVVEGALLRATAGKADLDHGAGFPVLPSRRTCRGKPAILSQSPGPGEPAGLARTPSPPENRPQGPVAPAASAARRRSGVGGWVDR